MGGGSWSFSLITRKEGNKAERKRNKNRDKPSRHRDRKAETEDVNTESLAGFQLFLTGELGGMIKVPQHSLYCSTRISKESLQITVALKRSTNLFLAAFCTVNRMGKVGIFGEQIAIHNLASGLGIAKMIRCGISSAQTHCAHITLIDSTYLNLHVFFPKVHASLQELKECRALPDSLVL